MTDRELIDQYRAERPWLAALGPTWFPDDLVAADLTLRGDMGTGDAFGYDCIADVPLELKTKLAILAEPEFEHPKFGLRPAALAMTPTTLVNFRASPHGGSWKPLPDHGGEPGITCRSFFHHSIVGSAAGCWGYFANKTSLESTFIVHKSGYFWQCMSLAEQADAQYHANGWAASAETEDNGDPNTDPWTTAMMDTLVWLTWEVDRLCPGMSLQVLRTWDGSGVGFHSQFGAPSNLTPAAGKTCPGTIRKRQWYEIVVPAILGGGGKLMLDDTDKAYIEGKMTALRETIRDQDLRRLGHAIVHGAAAGSNLQYDARRAGYEWLEGNPGLLGLGRKLDGLAGSLAAALTPLLREAIAEAVDDNPIAASLSSDDRLAIIEGAGDRAAAKIAERMAS